jgi:hypothetical protein
MAKHQILSLSEWEALSKTPGGVPAGASVCLSPSEYKALFPAATQPSERLGRLSHADWEVMHGDAYQELSKAFVKYVKTLQTVKALPDPEDYAIVSLLQIGISVAADNARIIKAVAAGGLSGGQGAPEIDDYRALLEMARHVLNGDGVTKASLKAATFAPNHANLSPIVRSPETCRDADLRISPRIRIPHEILSSVTAGQ